MLTNGTLKLSPQRETAALRALSQHHPASQMYTIEGEQRQTMRQHTRERVRSGGMVIDRRGCLVHLV
jgi:hypothetical protein